DLEYAGSQFAPAEDPGRAAESRLRHIHWLQDCFTAAEAARPPVIAAKSPLAVAGAKASLNYSRGRTVEEGLRHVALWNAATLASADLGTAVKARLSRTEAAFPDLDA
ncbi:MAG TPA: enoyl-CoA hydratase, partial [Allosphingosinicella sp.]|nr:enoyl-CoA hydratase [Allosphingosinicella sp.]